MTNRFITLIHLSVMNNYDLRKQDEIHSFKYIQVLYRFIKHFESPKKNPRSATTYQFSRLHTKSPSFK